MFKQFQKNRHARKRKEAIERWPLWVERAFMPTKHRGPLPEILRTKKPKRPLSPTAKMQRVVGYKFWYVRVRGEVRRLATGDTRSVDGLSELKVPNIHELGDYLRRLYHQKNRKRQSLETMRSGPKVGYQSTM